MRKSRFLGDKRHYLTAPVVEQCLPPGGAGFVPWWRSVRYNSVISCLSLGKFHISDQWDNGTCFAISPASMLTHNLNTKISIHLTISDVFE